MGGGVRASGVWCARSTPSSHLLDHDTVDACVLEASCVVKQVQPAQHQGRHEQGEVPFGLHETQHLGQHGQQSLDEAGRGRDVGHLPGH